MESKKTPLDSSGSGTSPWVWSLLLITVVQTSLFAMVTVYQYDNTRLLQTADQNLNDKIKTVQVAIVPLVLVILIVLHAKFFLMFLYHIIILSIRKIRVYTCIVQFILDEFMKWIYVIYNLTLMFFNYIIKCMYFCLLIAKKDCFSQGVAN